MSHHLMQGPFQLQLHLEKSEQEYLSFIHQMRVIFFFFFYYKIRCLFTFWILNYQFQEPKFKERIELEIEAEKKINVVLQKNKDTIETEVRQLELEVENIIQTKNLDMIDIICLSREWQMVMLTITATHNLEVIFICTKNNCDSKNLIRTYFSLVSSVKKTHTKLGPAWGGRLFFSKLRRGGHRAGGGGTGWGQFLLRFVP